MRDARRNGPSITSATPSTIIPSISKPSIIALIVLPMRSTQRPKPKLHAHANIIGGTECYPPECNPSAKRPQRRTLQAILCRCLLNMPSAATLNMPCSKEAIITMYAEKSPIKCASRCNEALALHSPGDEVCCAGSRSSPLSISYFLFVCLDSRLPIPSMRNAP